MRNLVIKAIPGQKNHQSRFFSRLGSPPSRRSTRQADRSTRLYSAAGRQTECRSRSCRSIDHTKVLHIRRPSNLFIGTRSSCHMIGLFRVAVRMSFPFLGALSFKEENKGKKEKKRLSSYHQGTRSINQSCFGIHHSIKLQYHAPRAVTSNSKSLKLAKIINSWKIAVMAKTDRSGSPS